MAALPFSRYRTVRSEKSLPCAVRTGAENVARLWGKYEIGDAAQYGLQRFNAKSVAPTAPDALQLDHFVWVRRAPASAHEMMKLAGRVTSVPRQVHAFGSEPVASVRIPP